MSEKSNTLLPVLLVVGLLVGAGGGYFYANNSLQPQIDELDQQISSINSEINGVSAQIDDYNDDIEAEQENIDDLEDDKEAREEEYSQVLSELEASQVFSRGVLDRKEELELLFEPQTGCYKFNMFGISFDCPKDTKLDLAGALGGPAEGSWSMVIATQIDEEFDLGLTWVSVLYYEGVVEAGINGVIDALTQEYEVEITEEGNTTIAGYAGKYLIYSGDVEGYYYGVIAAFYCHADSKAYIIQYNAKNETILANYVDFFNSIRVGET